MLWWQRLGSQKETSLRSAVGAMAEGSYTANVQRRTGGEFSAYAHRNGGQRLVAALIGGFQQIYGTESDTPEISQIQTAEAEPLVGAISVQDAFEPMEKQHLPRCPQLYSAYRLHTQRM